MIVNILGWDNVHVHIIVSSLQICNCNGISCDRDDFILILAGPSYVGLQNIQQIIILI